jgi:hypothetical protein
MEELHASIIITTLHSQQNWTEGIMAKGQNQRKETKKPKKDKK